MPIETKETYIETADGEILRDTETNRRRMAADRTKRFEQIVSDALKENGKSIVEDMKNNEGTMENSLSEVEYAKSLRKRLKGEDE